MTGTITHEKPAVATEAYFTASGKGLAPVLLGLANSSKHPVSVDIACHVKSFGVQPQKVENIVSVAGNGIKGHWEG